MGLEQYINVNLTKGQWCAILVMNGLVMPNEDDAIARWYVNSNNTATIYYYNQEVRTIQSFNDTSLYYLSTYEESYANDSV